MNVYQKKMSSPVGTLTLLATDEALLEVSWPNEKPHRLKKRDVLPGESHPLLTRAATQLQEYFEGKRESFDLPIAFEGTEFQRRVWEALRGIPHHRTVSYNAIARQIGKPAAVRAVGAAIGRNPISIIVPCHRVIGSNGKLTGFAGGLETKAALLKLESSVQEPLRM
jgi:methylated-DNA-[protein]-cysteine S-methyltransferase